MDSDSAQCNSSCTYYASAGGQRVHTPCFIACVRALSFERGEGARRSHRCAFSAGHAEHAFSSSGSSEQEPSMKILSSRQLEKRFKRSGKQIQDRMCVSAAHAAAAPRQELRAHQVRMDVLTVAAAVAQIPRASPTRGTCGNCQLKREAKSRRIFDQH